MSLLPQLESELLSAHGRRATRPRIDLRGAAAVLAGAAVVVAVVVAIAVAGHREPSSSAQRSQAPPPPGTAVVRGINGAVLYVGGGALYLGRPTSTGTNLVHLDAFSGQVICVVGFPDRIDHVLLVGGALWVTTSAGERTSLWEIDPNTGYVMAPTLTLPGSGPRDGHVGSLAVVDGRLWVGNAQALIQVAPASATITGVVAVPGAHGVEVAAEGSSLVISEGE